MTADERINDLIARAGSPVMIVKGEDKYSASDRLGQIEKRAKRMGKELHCRKYECAIDIMSDEIIVQDAKIRDMVNTIDRLEAALSNVINERDQLFSDLKWMVNKRGFCEFCKHNNKSASGCDGCTRENDHWEWRGVPVEETQK